MYVAQYDSPLGKLLLTCEDTGLTGLWMNWERLPDGIWQEDHPVFRETRQWLKGYFRGEVQPVTVALAPEGTEFQKCVWRCLCAIPWGKTVSYGEIGKEVAAILGKDTMSAQAIGQAVGRNPISILIPCHRVIGANGQLTGYAGGLERKIWLLEREGHRIADGRVL